MTEFLLPVRVYIEDTDASGIVYYVNYLKFMERARTEWLRSLGFNKAGANLESYQFVVKRAAIEYHRPARLDDELVVSASVLALNGASIELQQRVVCKDQLLAEAQVLVACVEGATMKPLRLPTDMKKRIQTTYSIRN